MKHHDDRVALVLIMCFVIVACNVTQKPRPVLSPVSPLAYVDNHVPIYQFESIVPPNLLVNGGFDMPSHYEPKGEMGIVLPTDWKGWAIDQGGYLKLYQPSGVIQLGRYRDFRFGVRTGQDSEVLKPEILHICRVQPYLDPPRIYEGECSVTGFKLYGHLAFGIQQTFSTIPGHVYRFTGHGHAWSRMAEDPNDAHYSHGVGTAAFYGEEFTPEVNGNNDNFRFRLCVDPFGAENVFGSAVQCGRGAMIYNVFHSIPSIEFTARSDSATVFAFIDNLFGMVNSNAFMDSLSVVDVTLPPTQTPFPTDTPTPTITPTVTPTRAPTVTPIPVTPGVTVTCKLTLTQRVYVLLPPGSGIEWYEAALPVVSAKGWSLGTSAVDACVNSCGHRTVIVVNAQQWGCNLYSACRAPCGSLQYHPVAVETPNDLAGLLDRYPEWLREAWGLCLPSVTRSQ